MTDTNTEKPAKPVSATERRAIEKLLEEDFNTVAQELRDMGETAKRDRTAAIRKERSARGTKAVYWNERINQVLKEAREDGFKFMHAGYSNTPVMQMNAEDTELAFEIQQAIAEVQDEIAYATSLLRRKLLDAKRSLLTSCLSNEALALLNSVPTAPALLTESRQHSQEAIEAFTS